MVARRRLTAWLLGGIGIVLVAVIPETLGQSASTDLLLGLSLVGAALLWTGAIWDDTICRARRDERFAEIHYRAGYNTALALGALLGTLIFVMTNLDIQIDVMAITGVLVAGMAVYLGSLAWLRRTM